MRSGTAWGRDKSANYSLDGWLTHKTISPWDQRRATSARCESSDGDTMREEIVAARCAIALGRAGGHARCPRSERSRVARDRISLPPPSTPGPLQPPHASRHQRLRADWLRLLTVHDRNMVENWLGAVPVELPERMQSSLAWKPLHTADGRET